VDRLTYILDISPASGNKSMLVGLCGGGGGNRGSLVCCGVSGILLEARQWVFPMEHGGIGVRVRRVPW
jgi:hypothetical protein